MTGLAADAALVVQAALVLAVLEAVRRRSLPAIVNGLVSLGAALLPAGLRAVTGLVFGPELPLWIAVAGLIHTVGMLGLYDSFWWWDHLAHGVSSALLTALIYAAVLVVPGVGPLGPLTPLGVVGVTLGLLLVFAVLWELIEELAHQLADRYDIGPVLEIYGPLDWLFDLAFNFVGAGLVILLDLRVFVPLLEPYPYATATVLFAVAGIALGLVGLLALVLGVASDDWP